VDGLSVTRAVVQVTIVFIAFAARTTRGRGWGARGPGCGMLGAVSGRKQWSLARQLLVLQAVIVGVLVAGGVALEIGRASCRERVS
jgi:hypothetical protein